MKKWLLLLVFFGFANVVSAANPLVVKYMGNQYGVDERYYLEIIENALKITEPRFGSYRIEYTEEPISAMRKKALVLLGERVNIDRIAGFYSNKNAYENLLQVKIPLLNGFMGYRVPLIRSDNQRVFDKTNTLEDLRNISMGLAKGWDGYIYKANGLDVFEPISMASLLNMLAANRFGFVPLSIVEIENQYEIKGESANVLSPEKKLLLYMPLPVYFYVSPRTPELAERLSLGLQEMQNNGSMKNMFDKYFSAKLKKLELSKRTIIELKNPDDDGSLGVNDHKDIEEY